MNREKIEYNPEKGCIVITLELSREDILKEIEVVLRLMREEVKENLFRDENINEAYDLINKIEQNLKSIDLNTAMKSISEKIKGLKDFRSAVICLVRSSSEEEIKKIQGLTYRDIVMEWNLEPGAHEDS